MNTTSKTQSETPPKTPPESRFSQLPAQSVQFDGHRARSVQTLLPESACQMEGGSATKKERVMAVSNYVQSTDRASQNWLARAQSVGWSESIQSVLEQPPAAFPRYLILLGLAFTGFFGLWAWTGTMQEVSQAQGELLPLGDTYKIQSATVGALDKIWVKEGDRIRQGQLLFELDATTAQSEVTRLEQTLAATQQTLDQTLALMSDMQAESVSQAQIAAASIQAQIATQAQSQANMQTSQALLEGLGSEMAAQQERLTRISSLESQGAISKEYLFGIEQGVRDQQKAIVQTQGEFETSLGSDASSRSRA